MTPAQPRAQASPSVSVIVLNWNGKQITLECLRSLAQVTYRQRSIIVVDNASSDGSVSAIRGEFPDVILLSMDRNLRFAGGNNAGMRYALDHGADMVLLLNNDTIVDPDLLSHLVGRLQADASYGMATPGIYYFDSPDRYWFAGGRISFWTGTSWHTGIREADTGQYSSPRTIDYASGCCVLTTREVIEKVGMLDETYFIYGEDADWSMRVRRAGYSIIFEPKAKVWHKVSVSSGGHLSSYKLRHKFLSSFRFFARYAAWYHWLVFPWLSVLANGFSAARYLVRRR